MIDFVLSLKEFNIELSDKQLQQFNDYYDLLIEWNSFMNLTSITDRDEVLLKHFIDSLSIVKAVQNMTSVSYSVLDVGTGAGFPGIPIKIAFPNLKITLLDSLNKRVNFLNTVIEKLGLSDINAIHGRAEDFGHDMIYRQQYDIVVSRAVANLTVLSEFCLPFVKVGGEFISFKSEKVKDEFNQAENAIQILGGNFSREIEFNLPFSDIYRDLFVISKNRPTPFKFPRKAGTPVKNPLF